MPVNKQDIQLAKGAISGTIISNLTIFAGPLYIGSLMDGLGFSELEAGLGTTLELSAVAISCLLIANFLPRLSLRYLAMAGMGIALASNLFCMFTTDHLTILMLRTVAGIGAGFCLASSSSLLGRMVDPDKMVAIMMMVTVMVMMMIVPVMGYAKELWMYGGMMGVYSLVLLALFPLFFYLPAKPHAKNEGGVVQVDNNQHYDPKWVLGIMGVGLLILFCVIESSVWAFSERSASFLGMAEADIGIVLASAQGFGLLGAAMPAILGNRMPFIYPVAIGGLLIGLAGLTIYQTSSELIYIIGMCVFCFSFFMAFPYLIGACSKLDDEGRWAARAFSLNLLGGAAAPFVAASIVSGWGYEALGTFCLVMALICIAIAVLFYNKVTKDVAGLELKAA